MAADDPLSAVDPYAVPPVTRRSELKLAAAINVLAGGWLVVAPSVVAYAPGDPSLPDRLVGFVVAAIGLARFAGFLRASPIGWVAAALGGWLLLSAVLLADSDGARWSEAVTGAVVLTAGTVGAAVSALQRRWLRS
jgi:hypothetical protein